MFQDIEQRRSLRDDESGALAPLHGVVMLLLLALAAAEINVYRSARAKVEAQNAADSAALAAALTMARANNALVGANDLHGQLAALIALQDAVGGPNLARRERVNTWLLTALDWSLRGMGAGNPELSFMTRRLTEPVKAGAALYDARVALREWGLVAHGWMFAAKAAAASVLFSGLAPAFYAMAYGLEAKLVAESYVLDVWEATAVAHAPIVEGYRALLPVVAAYAERVARSAGPEMVAAARDTAAANGWSASLVPEFPRLPVARELPERGSGRSWPGSPGTFANPTRELIPDADLRPVRTKQHVRAAYPWVDSWRRPVSTMLTVGATLSGAAGRYRGWSNALLLVRADELLRSGLGLHILRESTPDSKGSELWTMPIGSRRADALFGVVVAVTGPPPRHAAPALFGPRPPIVAVAQAMAYNPNPKSPGGSGRQPVVGFDTLNWSGPTAEFGSDLDLDAPIMRPGWDAALVPVSRMPEIPEAAHLPAPVRDRFGKLPLDPAYWTH
jgi:hypothetical protein